MMDIIRNFPAFSILISLLAAIVSAVLGDKRARTFSIAVTGVVIAMSGCTLVYTSQLNESFIYMMGHFPAPWGNEIRAGVLEAFLATALTSILFLSVLGGVKDVFNDIEEGKVNLYFVMINLIQAAILALIYTNDLFTAYVFVEICTLASCGILMIRNIGRTTIAAIRYMIFSLLGSGLFLIGVVLLYNITGHLLMSNIKEAVAGIVTNGQYGIALTVIVALISIGLAIKSGMFPFHFWMADTYGCSTTSSGAILSGLVSKVYILLLIKIMYRVIGRDVIASTNVQNVLFVFGLCGMIAGSLSAIKENNIKRMIAFSSAAQIGYIYMGIGLNTTVGMVAAIFHILTHALTKPLLFISAAGLSRVSGGSEKFSDLQGAAHRNRFAGLAFTVGAVSMVGIPTFAGFVSKLMFATSAVQNPYKMLPTLIVLALSTVLNTVYFLRTVMRIYTPAERATEHIMHVGLGEQIPVVISAVLLIAGNIYMGLHSQPIIDAILNGLNMFA